MTGSDVVASYTEHVLRVVAHLIAIEARTGRTVQLALEPEPFCFLETTDETVAYFTDHLYSGPAAERLAKLAHIPVAEAIGALRRHLGVVYDICHQAVEYENITESLQKLVDSGIPIFKLQEAAALYIPEVTQGAVETLKRYAKTIYLTQTIEKRNGKLNRYLNVDDAIAAFEKDPGPREWRTHIHVPVFLDDLGQFRTTRFAIEDALRMHKQKPLSRQLEIETYTWDMPVSYTHLDVYKRQTSMAVTTPSAPSKRPASRTVSIWEPSISVSDPPSRALRRPTTLPAASIRTAIPASRIQPATRSAALRCPGPR